MVFAVAVLLAAFGSVPEKVAVAAALAEPAVVALTLMVMTAGAALASDGMSQVTEVAVLVQVPPFIVALTTAAPVTGTETLTGPALGPPLSTVTA